jgi:hypothetical protein
MLVVRSRSGGLKKLDARDEKEFRAASRQAIMARESDPCTWTIPFVTAFT